MKAKKARKKLFTVRTSSNRYYMCSNRTGNIQAFDASSSREAMKLGTKWFGHPCYVFMVV